MLKISGGLSRIRSSRLGLLAKALGLALSILYPAASSASSTALPGVTFDEAPLVSPTAALSYYGTPTSPTAKTPTEVSQRVKDLARALSYDPYLIDEHIRTTYELSPYFGLSKGANGVILDGNGTPFDLAELMVDMVRLGGHSARYRLGLVELDASQFLNWFGSVGENQANPNQLTVPALVACRLFANGGIPALVNGQSDCSNVSGSLTSARFIHVWVEVSVNSQWLDFDPSQRVRKFYTGENLNGLLAGCTIGNSSFVSSVLASATSSQPATGVSRLELPANSVLDELHGCASTLVTQLDANHKNTSVLEIVGGSKIDQTPGTAAATSTLPYQITEYANWQGEIPDVYATFLTVTVEAMTNTHRASEIYDKVYSIMFEDGALQVVLDFEVLSTQTLTNWFPESSSIDLNLVRPFAANSGTFSDVNVTKPFTSENVNYLIALSLGQSGRGRQRIFNNYEPDTSYAFGDQTAIRIRANRLMFSGLQQWHTGVSTALNFIGAVSQSSIHVNQTFGIATVASINDTDTVYDIDANISVLGTDGTSAEAGTYNRFISSIMSGFEAYVMAQPHRIESASQAIMMGKSGLGVLEINALNWPAARTHMESLAANLAFIQGGEPLLIAAELDFINSYVQQGYTVYASERPVEVHEIPMSGYDPDFGTILMSGVRRRYFPWNYVAVDNSGAAIAQMVGSRKGLVEGSEDSSAVVSMLEDFGSQGQVSDLWENKDVSLRSGQLSFSKNDLTIGTGRYPESLPFVRTYTSTEVSGMKLSSPARVGQRASGWTHNYVIEANLVSDANLIFGGRDPRAAADAVVATLAAQRVAESANGLEQAALFSQITAWLLDESVANAVSIDIGPNSVLFARLPVDLASSGQTVQYAPPYGQHGSLTAITNSVSSLKNYFDNVEYTDVSSVEYDFGSIGPNMPITIQPGPVTISFPTGEQVVVENQTTYNDFSTHRDWETRVSNSYGRSLTISTRWLYANNNTSVPITTTVTDDTGRTVELTFNSARYLHASTNERKTWRLESSKNVDSKTELYSHHSDYPELLVGYETPMGRTPLSVVYGLDRRVNEVDDAEGNTTEYRIAGNRGEVLLPTTQTSAAYFSRAGRTLLQRDGANNETVYEYDEIDRITSRISPEGNKVVFAYDDLSNVVAETRVAKPGSGLANLITTKEFDDPLWPRKPTRITNPRGDHTDYSYRAVDGLSDSIKLASGTTDEILVTLSRGLFGRLEETVVDPTGVNEVNRIAYYPIDSTSNAPRTNGEQKEIIVDAGAGRLNLTSTMDYGPRGDVISITDPRGYTHSFGSDVFRRYSFVTAPDPDGSGGGLPLSESNIYDDDGRFVRAELRLNSNAGPILSLMETDYDDRGNPRMVFNEECFDTSGFRNPALIGCGSTETAYDLVGRVDVITDAVGRKTKMTYDEAGRLAVVTRAFGSTQTYTNGNSLEQAYQTFTYTPNGQVETVTDANGNVTHYYYDGHDRLEKTEYPHKTISGSTDSTDYEMFGYDANGNLLWKRTRAGDYVVSSFDALNREASQEDRVGSLTGPIENSIVYTYDGAGRMKSVSQTDGYSIVYEYDGAGRLDFVIDNGRTIDFDHDASDNLVRIDYPGVDGFYVTYDYDDAGRLKSINEKGVLALATYSYDDRWRRDQATLGNGRVITYEHFDDGPFKKIEHKDLLGPGDDAAWILGYSAANQTVSKSIPAELFWQPTGTATDSYVSNGLNQYSSINGQSFGYDGNGSITSDGPWTYDFDVRDRLRSAMGPGVNVTYEYDPLGRRSKKAGLGVVTEVYLSAGAEEIADYDGSGSLLRRYVHGLGVDERLVMYTGTSLNSREYYHTDHQGTTVAMSGSDGSLQDVYTYGPFGETGLEGTSGNPFRYTGRRIDPETGLYYYRARYYSPSLGRFIQADPIGYADSMNLYSYTDNDPVNLRDPSGLCSDDPNCVGNYTWPTRPPTHPQTNDGIQDFFNFRPNPQDTDEFVADPENFGVEQHLDIGTQIQDSIVNGGKARVFFDNAVSNGGLGVFEMNRIGFAQSLRSRFSETGAGIGRFSGNAVGTIKVEADGSYVVEAVLELDYGKYSWVPDVEVGNPVVKFFGNLMIKAVGANTYNVPGPYPATVTHNDIPVPKKNAVLYRDGVVMNLVANRLYIFRATGKVP